MGKVKKLFLCLVILVGAAAAMTAGKFYAVLTHMGGGQETALSLLDRIRNPRGAFPGRDRLHVLLIGKDYNRDRKGMPYTKGARSDTLIMLSLDLATERVSALSIPRDTYVEFPDTRRHGKINAAYARGGADPDASARYAMATVGHLLGIHPDYYIALKPDAVKRIVDQLGGVEVEVLDRMKYHDSWGQLHIDLEPGKQIINGEQAVGFTRYRKPNDRAPRSQEDGDERRMARQQQLLRAMVQKAKQPQMLLQAEHLIDASLSAIETDLSRPQILALAALFRHMEPDQMQTATLSGENYQADGDWYFRPDREKMTAQVDWLLRGDEAAAYRLTTVAVKNGTEVKGAARQVADLLRDLGFDARNAGNQKHAEEIPQTRILYGKAAVASRARRIADLLRLRDEALLKQPQESLDGADVTIVLGRDVAPNFAPRTASVSSRRASARRARL